ncbi:MAG: hypothetical protein MUE84_17155, partial [Hyphomonas sp.]|nr:hypothetical protein [Hyphomonas sp.]
MNINLQLTAIDLDPRSVNFAGADYLALVADTQGNILKPHGRDFAQNLFFQFVGNPAAVKTWLKNKIAPLITSAAAQGAQTAAFKANGTSAGFVNAALSADGYRALGFVDTQLPSDPSFLRGMKHPDTTAFLGLNDPPVSAWQSGFQQAIHLLIALADDDQARLAQLTQTIIADAATIATVVDQEPGQVFRNDRGQVIEHFGFTDGVSQPLFLADDIEKARLNDGIDVYDPSAPLGLALLKDPMGSPAGYGSYFVFRKLSQNVAGFRQNEAQLASALGLSG